MDEVNKVDAKCSQIASDLEALKNTTNQRFEEQEKVIHGMLLDMNTAMANEMRMLSETMQASVQANSTLMIERPAILNQGVTISKAMSPLSNIAVTALALGAFAWMYVKINN